MLAAGLSLSACHTPPPRDDVATMDAHEDARVAEDTRDVPRVRESGAFEASCEPAPPLRESPLGGNPGCSGCVQAWPSLPRELFTVRERDGEFEVPARDYISYFRPGDPNFRLMNSSLEQGVRGLCPRNFAPSTFGMSGEQIIFNCFGDATETGFRMFLSTLSADRRTTCRVAEVYRETLGFAPNRLMRVPGAYAWVEGYQSSGPGDLTILDDGSSEPRRFTHCNCMLEAGAADDTIVYIRDSEVGMQQFAELWTLRPPYQTPQRVWAAGYTMQWLRQDPTDHHRFVFAASREGCEAGADIFVFDSRTIARDPPQNITRNASTQTEPVLRGDWIAYLDYSRDTLNPNGCVSDRHNALDRVMHNMVTGQRVVINSPGGAAIAYIGTTHVLVGNGWYVPLPAGVTVTP